MFHGSSGAPDVPANAILVPSGESATWTETFPVRVRRRSPAPFSFIVNRSPTIAPGSSLTNAISPFVPCSDVPTSPDPPTCRRAAIAPPTPSKATRRAVAAAARRRPRRRRSARLIVRWRISGLGSNSLTSSSNAVLISLIRVTDLKGTQTPDPASSSEIVLMDEPAQDVALPNACTVGRPGSRIRLRVRRLELKTSVGPSPVVVGGVDSEHPLQVTAAEHQHPVQALGPDRADPPFGECVRPRSPDRGFDDVHALGGEDLVEGTGELGVSVPDHEPDPREPLPHCQVASLLGTPRRVGVPGDAEDVHPPRSDLDGEEHVQGAKPKRLDGEEVQRQDPPGLGPEELTPGGAGSPGSRAEAVRPQQRADLRRRDRRSARCCGRTACGSSSPRP